MRGNYFILVAALLLPAACVIEETVDDNGHHEDPCADECREWGWCTYDEQCGCVPVTDADCQNATACTEQGWCGCVGIEAGMTCPDCQPC